MYNMFLLFYLGKVPNLCEHSPTRSVFCRIQDTGITQIRWVLAGFNLVSVILINVYVVLMVLCFIVMITPRTLGSELICCYG